MKLFLGVDGGQSSTVALIADETGRVIGSGQGGPCNHVAAAEGRAKFNLAITACLTEASSQAGISAEDIAFEAACLGFSGGATDKAAYSRELIRSKLFKITHDAEIALTGATAGEPGIIVIAGTGSIAFGKGSSGKTARAGGWGYLFGDEGGAFDLVRQALRASLAWEEGWGPETVLHRQLLALTGRSSANELLHAWYNQFDRSQIASLASLLDKAALQNDLVSNRILKQAAQSLAKLATEINRLLFSDADHATVCYVGGVFESKTLTQEFTHLIQHSIGRRPVSPQFPPAGGALLEALRMANPTAALSSMPVIKT